VRREQRRAVTPAARRIALDLEKTAVRSEPGKIRVTGAARLPGLPRVAWQSLRRLPGGGDHCQRSYEGPNPQYKKDLPSATSPGSHGDSPNRLQTVSARAALSNSSVLRADFRVV